jgi:cation-transporting P-type ATPase G
VKKSTSRKKLWQVTEIRAAAVAGVLLLAGSHPVEVTLYVLALLIAGYAFVPSTLKRLARGKIGAGALMTIAAVGAVLLGEVEEAAMLV